MKDSKKNILWKAIIPIIDDNDLNSLCNDNYIFSDNIKISLIPEWFKNHKILADLSLSDKKTIKESIYCIYCEYTHTKSLDQIQNIKTGNVSKLITSFWLSDNINIRIKNIFHFMCEDDDFLLRLHQKIKTNICNKDEPSSVYSSENFQQTSKIFASILSLKKNDILSISLKLLDKILCEEYLDIRFLILCIIIESFFGSNIELTFRLSTRISFYLGKNKSERVRLYNIIKNAYNLRSKIVHGFRGAKKTNELLKEYYQPIESIIQKVFIKILLDDFEKEKILSSEREKYLDSLAFELYNK